MNPARGQFWVGLNTNLGRLASDYFSINGTAIFVSKDQSTLNDMSSDQEQTGFCLVAQIPNSDRNLPNTTATHAR